MQDEALAKRLENIFLKHYNEIEKMDDFPVRKAAAMVRKGTFFKDQPLIDEGYKILKGLDENNWIEGLKKELSEFDRNEEVTKGVADSFALIGSNFKRIREARGISKSESLCSVDLQFCRNIP